LIDFRKNGESLVEKDNIKSIKVKEEQLFEHFKEVHSKWVAFPSQESVYCLDRPSAASPVLSLSMKLFFPCLVTPLMNSIQQQQGLTTFDHSLLQLLWKKDCFEVDTAGAYDE
jgi:hypothetical protein